MELKKLKNSISLNSGEDPSIYSALCLVETLFKDIKDETGKSIQDNPAGSEMLPTKLVWLCRTVNEIYSANRGEFSRNTSKLDEKISDLRRIEKELDDYSSGAEKLSEANRRYSELSGRLEAAKREKREYDRILGECSEAEAQLAELKGFDGNELGKKTEAVKAQIRQLTADREKLFADYESSKAEKANAEAQYNELCEKCSTLKQEKLALDSDRVRLGGEISESKKQIAEIESENRRLAEEQERNVARHAALSAQKKTLTEEYKNYYDNNVKPIEESVSKLLADIESLNSENSTRRQEYKALKQKSDALTFEIAMVSKDAEDAAGKCDDKQKLLDEENAKLRQANDRFAALDGELSSIAGELEKIGADSAETEKVKLPQAKSLLAQEAQRFDEVTEKLNQLNAEIERIGTLMPETEKEFSAKEAVYAALTASYNTKSGEIKALEDKINELRGKTDDEKHSQYKLQLEADILRLNSITQECEKLEGKIKETESAIENAEAEQIRLKEILSSHKNAEESIKQLLNDLAYVNNDEFVRKIRSTQNRLELLTTAQSKLINSAALVAEVLGMQNGTMGELERLGSTITLLSQRTEALRKALVSCADSIKPEAK